jgi:hypothetical protein
MLKFVCLLSLQDISLRKFDFRFYGKMLAVSRIHVAMIFIRKERRALCFFMLRKGDERFMHEKWREEKRSKTSRLGSCLCIQNMRTQKQSILLKNDFGFFSIYNIRDLRERLKEEKLFAWIKESGGVREEYTAWNKVCREGSAGWVISVTNEWTRKKKIQLDKNGFFFSFVNKISKYKYSIRHEIGILRTGVGCQSKLQNTIL